MLSTLRRTALAAFACMALVGGVGIPVASASTPWYYNTDNNLVTIAPGNPWLVGPPHALLSNSGNVGGTACIGAIDYYGGGTAAGAVCGTFPWGFTTATYCGCITRDGAIYPFGGTGYVGAAVEYY